MLFLKVKRWVVLAVMVLAGFWLAAAAPFQPSRTLPPSSAAQTAQTISDTDRYGGMGGQYSNDPLVMSKPSSLTAVKPLLLRLRHLRTLLYDR